MKPMKHTVLPNVLPLLIRISNTGLEVEKELTKSRF
jgi:hypothetical protein